MFMGTLQGPYLEKMRGSVSSDFLNLVIAGERVENFLKNGKIQAATSNSIGSKNPFSNVQKNKEGKTNVFITDPSL